MRNVAQYVCKQTTILSNMTKTVENPVAICDFLRENVELMTELSFAIVKWSNLMDSSKTQKLLL